VSMWWTLERICLDTAVSAWRVHDSSFLLIGHTSGVSGTTVTMHHAEVLMHEPYGPQNGFVV